MSYYYLLWYRFKCVCAFGGFWQVRRVSTANPARPNEKVCETIKLLCNFGVEYQTFELPIIRLIASRVNKTGWVIPILSYLLWISMRTPFAFKRISFKKRKTNNLSEDFNIIFKYIESVTIVSGFFFKDSNSDKCFKNTVSCCRSYF